MNFIWQHTQIFLKPHAHTLGQATVEELHECCAWWKSSGDTGESFAHALSHTPVQETYGASGESPAKGHKND